MRKAIILGIVLLLLAGVALAGTPAMRVNIDQFNTQGGPGFATTGSPNVLINGLPAVTRTSMLFAPIGECGYVPPAFSTPGSVTVLINSVPAIRMGDNVVGSWGMLSGYPPICIQYPYNSPMVPGSSNVLIG